MDARPLARFFTRDAFGAPRKAVSGIRVQNISTKRDSAETGFLSPCRCAIVPRDPVSTREHPMALEPLAKRGNFFHIYDFRVKPGKGDEFIKLFDAFDYSDENPMHKSPAQVKDGVLCRDVNDPDQVLVTVEDVGIGLEPESLDRLFSPFYTTKPGGMGIGLSICRSIVEAHEGRVWASRNNGPGMTFQFTIPAYRDSPNAPAPSRSAERA